MVLAPNVRGSGRFGRSFVHADHKEKRFAAIDDVADCARFLANNGLADPRQIACVGWSYGGYLTQAALAFHPGLFAAGVSICGMSDLSTFGHPVGDRELLEQLSPLRRVDALVALLLVVHGAHDTNVPVSESEQSKPCWHHCSVTSRMRSAITARCRWRPARSRWPTGCLAR